MSGQKRALSIGYLLFISGIIFFFIGLFIRWQYGIILFIIGVPLTLVGVGFVFIARKAKQSVSSGRRICPYCEEAIDAEAMKCPSCGSYLG